MTKRKVLLLNPPGSKIYIRDYYCSKVSKARYLYHPVDLLMLSGTISKHHDVRVLDGMLDGWSPYGVIRAAQSFNPDVIVFLTGVVSFHDDLEFMAELKQVFPFIAIASGELFLGNAVDTLRSLPAVDAAVLDFTENGILDLIERISEPGQLEDGPEIRNIIYRSGDRIIGRGLIVSHGSEYELEIPRHDLFPNDKYRYPFVRRFPFATVLTDFGCPYKCDFCAINQLGFKKRSVNNVLEELDFIKKLGFKDIYFDDQTFGADRKRSEKLLGGMIDRDYRLGFICFTRADTVDRELLKLMKAAGCHTVVFGVESVGDTALAGVKKDLTLEKIREAISWCRLLGIRTVGTFIVGLPGMTVEEAASVGDFAVSLGLDFASFNVPAPRPGTGLRKLALESGWIDDELREMDQSGSYAVMGNEHMTAEQVGHYRNLASRKFYVRFGYVFRRLTGIRTWYEFKSHVQEGIDLLTPSRFVRKH